MHGRDDGHHSAHQEKVTIRPLTAHLLNNIRKVKAQRFSSSVEFVLSGPSGIVLYHLVLFASRLHDTS